jgi:hypothetical protein
MDKKTYAIGILSLSALIMVVANLLSTPSRALGDGVVNSGRDYQVITARVASGGDALYIVDNRTGMIGVFTYDTQTRRMVPRVVSTVAAAFPAGQANPNANLPPNLPPGGTVPPRTR